MPTPVLLDHRDPTAAEQIRRVLHAGYRVEAALIGVQEFPPLSRTAADVAASPCRFAGCYGGAALAGVIEYDGGDGAVDRPVDIASLGVDPRQARRGIGSRLVRFVMETNPGRAYTVSTARSNLPAIALYRQLGFRVDGHFATKEGIECVSLVRPG